MTTKATMPCERPSSTPAMAQADALRAGVPQLETARLILRAPILTDFETYAAVACGPRGAGMGGPMTRAAAWLDFASMVGCWLLRGHGLWSVYTKDTATHVGFVLIGFEPGDLHHELGFVFTEAAEGKGLAHEAARAALDYARETLAVPVIDSYIFPDNARSIALAERLGATCVGDHIFPEDDVPSRVFRYPDTTEA